MFIKNILVTQAELNTGSLVTKELNNEAYEYDAGYSKKYPVPSALDESPKGIDGEYTDEQKDRAGEIAVEQLEERIQDDPLGYLDDIYGDYREFPNIESYIDEDALIEGAVQIDGRGHFLSPYDGTEHEGVGDVFYYRTN